MSIRNAIKTIYRAAFGVTAIAMTLGAAQAQRVQGLIAERYSATGGATGPLGRVTSNETEAADHRGRYNQFQNGMIAYSPPTGPQSVQIIYRKGSKVYFQWSSTDPFNYDKFIVRWTINNGKANQIDVNGQGMSGPDYTAKASRTDGTFTLTLNPKDSVSIIVEGADKETFGSRARQGWTTPVWVGSAPATPVAVTPPGISVTATGANATSVFTVTGNGFTPNSMVTIRVVDDLLNPLYFKQAATKTGQLLLKQSIPCNGGYYLHFSATDGRPNPQDVTGSLWSNTFTILCPGVTPPPSGDSGSANDAGNADGSSSTQSHRPRKPARKIGALTHLPNRPTDRLNTNPAREPENSQSKP